MDQQQYKVTGKPSAISELPITALALQVPPEFDSNCTKTNEPLYVTCITDGGKRHHIMLFESIDDAYGEATDLHDPLGFEPLVVRVQIDQLPFGYAFYRSATCPSHDDTYNQNIFNL